ncbi:hypothetical protein N7532_006713 [Penicillium argentinense]|uniref:Uncharacterized protein n=1 Tax=Penicillium argentinense TaxID=1131581 RepID=A0A9W9FGT2_9EURO|nr:uncharacterized protein N7532_006713 [Penicillium argentinense]KAJ5099712.1 hypothetical protein N7532_006713 [Penicillium argentinense]
MGKLVKLLGAGIGFTSEAIQASRARSRESSPAGPSSIMTDHAPSSYDHSASAYAGQTGESSRSVPTRGDVDHIDEKKHCSKSAEAGYDSESDSSDSDEQDAIGRDEVTWELDEMAEQMRPPSYEESEALSAGGSEDARMMKEEEMIRGLVHMAGPPRPAQRLPCPVIIPQRRPRKKQYGFVRAYAPVLADSGVSQDVFLQFLSDWEKTSKSDSWINVVYVAANVVGFVPELAAQIISPIVATAAGTAKELQSRSRRNTFLDKFNEDVLMPRGLFSMIMTFKESIPDQQKGALQKLSAEVGKTFFTNKKLGIDEVAAKYSNPNPNMSKMNKGLQNIRLASGCIDGEIELSQSAELIYPDLDRIAEHALHGQGKGKDASVADKLKSASSWTQDYFDRRGQTFYEAKNPDPSRPMQSSQAPQFKSRYNDPNHPANSGSLVALLTGGAVDPVPRRKARRAARQARRDDRQIRRDARRVARGRSPRGPRKTRNKKQRKGMIKRLLQEDILYFFVVSLPSQEEVQESVYQLEHLMAQNGAASSR